MRKKNICWTSTLNHLLSELPLMWFSFEDPLFDILDSILTGKAQMSKLKLNMAKTQKEDDFVPVTCVRNLIPCDWLFVVTLSALLLIYSIVSTMSRKTKEEEKSRVYARLSASRKLYYEKAKISQCFRKKSYFRNLRYHCFH